MRHRHLFRGTFTLLVTGLVVVAAACGSDSKSSTTTAASASSAGTATTVAGPSSAAATSSPADADTTTSAASTPATTAAAGPATGEPIKLGTIQSKDTQASAANQSIAGINAAVKAINDHGGVNGRPLEVDACQGGLDQNAAAKCARDFGADSSIIALVGSDTNLGAVVNPELEKAELPTIGQGLLSTADLASPMLFPTDSGGFSAAGGDVAVCADQLQGKTFALAYIDAAFGTQLDQVTRQALLPKFDMTMTDSVPLPLTAADYSSQAAQIVQGSPDCVGIAGTQEQALQFTAALQQQGYQGHIMIPSTTIDSATLVSKIGSKAEGIVLIETYDFQSNLAKQFFADLEASGAPDSVRTDLAFRCYLGVKVLAAAAEKSSTVDRATVRSILQTLVFPTDGGLKTDLDYSKRVPNPDILGGTAPNMIHPYVIGVTITGGKPVPLTGDEWVNVFGL